VAEKYIQTSKGIFPLKFLCPRGPKGATAARIKNMIQETIDNEDKASPLSDSKLVEIIKGKGIYIDRRTAAYYRKELNIPSFEERKHGN
jgi:RNA polymerase sigma-54 factor